MYRTNLHEAKVKYQTAKRAYDRKEEKAKKDGKEAEWDAELKKDIDEYDKKLREYNEWSKDSNQFQKSYSQFCGDEVSNCFTWQLMTEGLQHQYGGMMPTDLATAKEEC